MVEIRAELLQKNSIAMNFYQFVAPAGKVTEFIVLTHIVYQLKQFY